jgi:hypothetical protein
VGFLVGLIVSANDINPLCGFLATDYFHVMCSYHTIGQSPFSFHQTVADDAVMYLELIAGCAVEYVHILVDRLPDTLWPRMDDSLRGRCQQTAYRFVVRLPFAVRLIALCPRVKGSNVFRRWFVDVRLGDGVILDSALVVKVRRSSIDR